MIDEAVELKTNKKHERTESQFTMYHGESNLKNSRLSPRLGKSQKKQVDLHFMN